MKTVPLTELAIVAGVGYLLAQGTKRVPSLNDNPILTRTLLYTLGYYLATRRPEGGFNLLTQSA
jgi:hypothetical protein